MRRNVLRGAQPGQLSHAGLWHDKFLEYHGQHGPLTTSEYANIIRGANEDSTSKITSTDPEATARLLKAVHAIPEPPIYAAFFERWRTALEHLGVTAQGVAAVQGRMVVGLGGEQPQETSITLHRTYGLPYIPGSALKGLTAHYANALGVDAWRKDGGEAHKIAFGTTESAGYVRFFDALYMPGSGEQGHALWPDVLTPHHQSYTQNTAAPTDTDSPQPIQFLSATGHYFVALAGPAPWTKAVFDLLTQALKVWGIGAKTSSGYGRLSLEMQRSKTDENAENLLRDLERFPPKMVPQQINRYVDRWFNEELSSAGKLAVAQAILQKIADANYRGARDRPWYASIAEYVQQHS